MQSSQKMAGTGRLRRERMKQIILIVSLLLWVDLLYAQEKTYRNSIGMEFVLIPSGHFLMGSDRRFEKGRHDEMPKHGVRFSHSFYIAKYEVTQARLPQRISRFSSFENALISGCLPFYLGGLSSKHWKNVQTIGMTTGGVKTRKGLSLSNLFRQPLALHSQ